MRRTWTRGRRGAVAAVSVTAVALGTLLAACGTGGGLDGYVAVGPNGGSGSSGKAVGPTGEVALVPLDGDRGSGDGPSGGSGGSRSPGAGSGGASTGTGSGTGARTGASSGGVNSPAGPGTSAPGPTSGTGGTGSTGGTGGGGSGGAPVEGTPDPPSSSPTPDTPAALTLDAPEREAADHRWCENVTVAFHNTGGTAARSGTVTFGTHIIGALGIDWATIESTQPLPAPIAAGGTKEKTYEVCVDAWRVPLGMHIETRDVSATWK
ncbi:hypothetical protein ACIQNU_28045 [Streptomyces sp. NPDC091292]|uniref:hypothetical protein n=1 Tax=Streptomyces sp. NPDC091292 TaxID=3365991 RepID=UPI0038179B00